MISKAFLSAAVLASFTAAFAADAPKEDAANADAAKLQGTWQVTKFVDHSEKAAPADEIKDMTFVFKGDGLWIRKDKDHAGHEMKYTLDPSTKPKSIDIDMGLPPVTEGIYKLDGDELTICVIGGSRTGLVPTRPSEFKASNPNKYSLFVLKKVKK
jgi:uncharacterized protein (TIGR03067 family)